MFQVGRHSFFWLALLTGIAFSANELILHYPFNESGGTVIHDSSGYGRNGSTVNGPAFIQSYNGNVIYLNGSNQYVSLPSGFLNSCNDITVCMWINIIALTNWARLFDFGNSGTTGYMFLAITDSNLRFAISTSGTGHEQTLDAPTLPTYMWKHVTVRLKGDSAQIYLDGNVAATSSGVITNNPSSLGSAANSFLGKSQFSWDGYLNGAIKDFRVYNYALTPADISSIYNSTRPVIFTWDNSTSAGYQPPTSGTWGTNNYWSPDGYSLMPWPSSGGKAVFGGTDGTYTVIVSGTQNVDSIAFLNDGYTVRNGTINLGSKNGISVAADKVGIINSVVSGTNGIIKYGPGQLTFGGNNNFSGSTIIKAGKVSLTNANALGTTSDPTTVESGAVLILNNGITYPAERLYINGTGVDGAAFRTTNYKVDTATWTGPITLQGASTIGAFIANSQLTISGVIDGAHQLTIAGEGRTTLSGANTYSGGTVLSSGTLRLGATNTLPTSTVITIGQNNENDAILDLNGYNQTIRGLAQGGSTGGTKGITNNGSGQATLTINNSSDYFFGYSIKNASNALNLIKNGSGKLTLSGTGISYTGTTTVNNGTLVFQDAKSFAKGASPASFSIASGATLEFNITSSAMSIGSSYASGTVISGSGILRKSGSDTLNLGGQYSSSYKVYMNMTSGIIDIQAGTIKNGGWQGGQWTNNKASMNIASGAMFDIWDGNDVYIDALTGNGQLLKGHEGVSNTLIVGVNNGSGVFSGNITQSLGVMSFTKNGTGTQTLSGTATYTGPTTINAGTLIIDGSSSSGSAVTVASGAKLSGKGNVAGSVTIQNGGILQPGNNSASKLRTGALTLNNSSILNWDLGSASDTVTITGNLILDGTINVSAQSGFTYGTYTIMTYSGTLTNNGLTVGTLPSGYTATISAGSGVVNLVVKANQTITFNPIPTKTIIDADFSPGATASSGLTVTYTSDNPSVATIVDGKIHIVGIGTSTITASQAGNANFNAAPNVNQTLTVNKANQTITFNPIPTKTIIDADFSPGATASSGLEVTYTSSNPSVATVVDGKIHIVGIGTSTITASQAGNVNFNAASNVQQVLTVNKANQTITFGVLEAKAYGDPDFSPGATASSGLTVTYTSSNSAVATVVGNTIIRIVAPGTAIITALQTGNASYNAAPSVQRTLTVNKADQTITFNELPEKTFGDIDFSPEANSSSGLSVSYTSSNTSVATIVSGKIHIIGAGTSTITASQSGDANYKAAPDVDRILTVNKADQSITFNALPEKKYGDPDFSPGATATSGLTVTYASDNTSVATIVSGKIHIVAPGTAAITASQAGNANYNAAPNVNQTLTVNKTNQTITFNALPVKTYGDADFSPGATASSGLKVSYTSSNLSVATIIDGKINIVGAGTTTITASQPGDDYYDAAADVNQTLTVNKKTQTITFAALEPKTYGDADFPPGATASSGLPVTYTSNNPSVASIDAGQIHIVGSGTAVITASQEGDENYLAAQSVDQTLIVGKKTQTIAFSALDSKTYGDADFAPGATASSGLPVTYTNGNESVATIVDGKIHIVGAGTTIITASQAGDSYYLAALNVSQELIVGKKAQSITFNELVPKVYGEADYEPGATASSGLPVTYTSSNESVATIVDGKIHIAGTGVTTITALQAGDNNYFAADNVSQNLTVNKANQTITFPEFGPKAYADPDFDPGATASSGLPISYTSSSPSVATIIDGKIHIVELGTATITASQVGNENYNAALSVEHVLTVGKADQAITFSLDAKTYGDPDFNPGATASSWLEVSYLSDNESVATIIDGKIHIIGAGTSVITAIQGGDVHYNAAPNVNQTLIVNKADQTITFLPIPLKSSTDPDFDLEATASSGLPVTYTSSNPGIATITGNTVHLIGVEGSSIITASQAGNENYNPAPDEMRSCDVGRTSQTIIFPDLPEKRYLDPDFDPGASSTSGLPITYTSSDLNVATIVDGKIHIVNPGTTIITASQSGNETYFAAEDVQKTLTVGKATQTITFAALEPKAFGDPDFDPGATASSGLPVTYSSSNPSVATIIDGKIHIVGGGTTTIKASQEGNEFYLAALDVEQALTVGKIAQTITFGVLEAKTYGDADFSPGATASSGLTVTYTSDNPSVATIVDGNIHIVGGGTATITASQTGDDSYLAADPVSQTLTVNKATQTITFGALAPKVYGDADFSPGATASSGLTVTYTSDNPSVATIVNGDINIVGGGTATITASQAGNDNYLAADPVDQTLTVNKATQTITFGALDAKVYGDPDFSPGATASSGLTVTYTSDNPSVATIVNGNIHIVGGGTATITATQAGNSNYLAADPVDQTLTVNKATQTITFAALEPKTYGDDDYSPGATASSGLTVTYSSSDLSVATIVNGKIHVTGVGSTIITASQAGDQNYLAADPVDQTLTINKATQTITFGVLEPKIYGDPDYLPGATASSGLPVTYSSSDLSVATIVDGKIHIVGAGTTTITATQAGDANYLPASADQMLTVGKKTQTITFPNFEPKTYGDANFSPGATASSGLAVVYTSSNLSVAIIVAGQIKIVGGGTTTITASQGGNQNYLPAPDVSQVLTVERVTQTITFEPFDPKTYGDADFSPAATASSGMTVTYSSNNPSVAAIVDGNIHITGAGTATITASQVGDNNYLPANQEQLLTVNKADQTITFLDLEPKTYGDIDYAPGAVASSGLEVAYSSSNLQVATINDGKIHIIGSGTTTITATQAGDVNYNAAPNVDKLLTVNKASQTIIFAELNPKQYEDADFLPEATASSGLTVTYSSGNPSVATIVSGKIHITGVGITTITASQEGNENYLAADNVDRILVVEKADQTITFDSLEDKDFGDPDYAPGAVASSGLTVTYTSSDLSVATIVDGKIHIVGTGTTNIIASQEGNENYNPAPDVSRQLTVGRTNQEIHFPPLAEKYYDDPDYEPWAVSSSGLTVTFSSSNSEVATIVNGKIHIVGTGTTIITASQAGNSDYRPAPDVTQTLKVNKADQLITFDSIELKVYGDTDFTLGATASSGLPVTYTISDTNIVTIVEGKIHIKSAGLAVISASQEGDTNYNEAEDVSQMVIVGKADQTITFDAIASKVYGDTDFIPEAASSSGLPVSYLSSDTNVATIVEGKIHIIGAGSTIIKAFQSGDVNFKASDTVERELIINKADQIITFPEFPEKAVDDSDFSPGAIASSGLDVTYTSSNPSVAVIVNGMIHITGPGTTTITASQGGDKNYNPAIDVSRNLTTDKLYQAITFDSLPVKTYGDSAFVPIISASSGLPVTLVSSDTGIATIVNDTVVIRGAGIVSLTAYQPGNETFIAAQEVSRPLIVNKKELLFTANDKSRVFREPNPILTWSVSGFVNNDSIAEIDTLPLISTTATIESSAGVYPISISGGSDNNYQFIYQNATLVIGKAQQSITFDSIPDHKITDILFVVVASASSELGITFECSDTSKIGVIGDTVVIKDSGCVTITARQAGNTNYDSAFSVSRRFCIETVPLERPMLIVNASDRIDQPITPSLKWHKVPGAVTYQIQIARDNQFTVMVYDSVTSDTVKLINTLATNTEYYWRVKAFNRSQSSEFSLPDSFTTIQDIPSVPELIVDDSDRTNQGLVVSLMWHSVQIADNYRIQLSKNRTFSNTISDTVLKDTVWTTDSLNINTLYYWRVLAGNRGGNSPFSAPDSFMTIPQVLEAPVILTVIPPGVCVGTSITIDWKEVAGALSYRAVISLDSLFTEIYMDTLVNGKKSLNLTDLKYDQTYFCHIDARAGRNRSAWSNVLKFTTLINDNIVQSSTASIISGNVSITPEIKIVSDTLSPIRGQIITVVEEPVAKNGLINVSHILDFSKSPANTFGKPVSVEYDIPDFTIDKLILDSATKKAVRPFFIDDSNRIVVINNSILDSSGTIMVSLDTLKRIFFGIDTIKPVIIDNTSPLIVTNGTIPLITGMCYDNVSNTKYMIYFRRGGNTQFDSVELNAGAENAFVKSLGEKAALDSSGLEYYICANDGSHIVRMQNKNISSYIINKSANTTVPVMKWHLFAPPASLVNDSISRLLSATLGEYGKKWRLYRYDNQPRDTLIEFNNGLSRFETGKAYWIKTRNEGFVFNIDSGITTPINKCYTIEIPPRKWSSISNPYLFPVSWASILDSSFANESTVIGPYAYADSAWVTPNSIEKLDPWNGYYVYNNSDSLITLRIPSIKYSQSLAKKTIYQQVLDWVVKGKDEISCNNLFGISNASSDNYDPLYDFPMPASPDNSVRTYFYRSGFASVAEKFQTDFTDYKDGGAIWHIKIENMKKGESYFCHINEIEKIPDSLLVYIIDLTTGIKWDMRKNDYGVQGSANVNEIAIDLVIGNQAYVNRVTNNYKLVPMQFTISNLYPNPVRHLARINYTIPYDPHRLRVPVSFSVFTMSGRKVFTINEPARSAGYYTLVIEISSANRTVSSGTYVYKLSAGKNWKSQVMKVLR